MNKRIIPDNPKVRIKGYTKSLPGDVKVLFNEMPSFLKADIQVLRCVSEKVGRTLDTIRRYLKSKRIPIFFLKELDNQIKVNIFEEIEKMDLKYLSKWKEVRLPSFINPKAAYFIGYLQGDGSIESNHKRINFTDEYLSQILHINELCENIFDIKGRIRDRLTPLSTKTAYTLEIGSKVLNSYIHNVFGINRGIKRNLSIPVDVLGNKSLLRWYIIGFFDADGTLPKSPDTCVQYFIDVTAKDKEFIIQLKEALEKFGIITHKPYCRVAKSPNSSTISHTWELRIRRKKDIIRFLNEIGFAHPNKHKRAINLHYQMSL